MVSRWVCAGVLAWVLGAVGPVGRLDAQVVRAADAAPVPVHVTTGATERLALSRLVLEGPRSAWTGRRLNVFEPICTAPCDVQLVPGPYRFGVSVDGRDTVETRGSLDVYGPTNLDIEYRSRRGARIAGWFILIASLVGGASMAIAGAAQYDIDNESPAYALMGAGLSVMLVGSLGVGLPFIAWRDHLEVVGR